MALSQQKKRKNNQQLTNTDSHKKWNMKKKKKGFNWLQNMCSKYLQSSEVRIEVKVYLSSTKKDASKNSSSLSEEESGAWLSSAIATAKISSCKLQIFRPSYWSLPAKFNLKFGVLESCWFRDWGESTIPSKSNLQSQTYPQVQKLHWNVLW